MRVLVTGATGYIGAQVAMALSRAGHDVLGLVRSPAKAKPLEAGEVETVRGDMADPDGWSAAARSCAALVHCASEPSPRHWELDGKTVDALLASAAQAGLPRRVIYTSGVWLYGDTGGALVDEASPIRPAAFVAPRQAIEERVLAANAGRVRTLSIRPGCVYGGSGGLSGAWFDSAIRNGKARIVGSGAQRWAMVHVEDLAELYVRAVESDLGGEVLNATDRSRFTVGECARAAGRAVGGSGDVETVAVEKAKAEMGAWAEALALDQHVDSRRAVALLGWQPRHGGFVDGADRYARAWRASQT